MSQIVGSDGSSILCTSAGSAPYATVPVVDQQPEYLASLSSTSQNYGDSVVAYPVVVFGPGQSVNRASLGDSPQTRSLDSSSGHALAPSVGFMEAMGVAPE